MLTSVSLLSQLVGRVGQAPLRRLCAQIKVTPKEEISAMTKLDKVVVFMKGTPDEPMCGFSRAVVKILDVHEVPFSAVNVLEDQGVREGVKAFSEWPTIPQIFLDGEFLGGCDIMIEMHQSGDLVKTLKEHGITSQFKGDIKE